MGRLGNAELDSRYEVLKLVNTGGTSQVYLAQDRRLNCNWAIKKIKKDSLAINTAVSEVNFLKDLNHPALPRIVDIKDDDDFLYIVMDYIQGENLRTILRVDGAQDQDTVVNWAIKICDVLTYLHKHNIIYRDMKPSNIMLTPEGDIKLIDFGIAREFNANANEDTTALGTEGYAAPEQYQGHGQSDKRTDVFGLGVTIFQLLTDINPVTYTENTFSIRLCNQSLSSGLDKIILKCTNKSKEKRYQSAEELKKALEHYHELDNEYIKQKQKRRVKFVTFLILSVLCFAISFILFFLENKQNDKEYEKLIAETNNIPKIEEAISINPDDERGYIALLNAYGEEISVNEASEFSHIFAENIDKINSNVAMIAGEKILTSYEEPSLRGKLLVAENYFKSVDSEYEKYDAANAYVSMAGFYKDYIMQNEGSLINEAGKKEYTSLLKNMEEIINSTSKYKGTEQKNLLLTACELSLNIIYDQGPSMLEQGVSKDKILNVVNLAENSASSIEPKVEVTKQKKDRILKFSKETRKRLKED